MRLFREAGGGLRGYYERQTNNASFAYSWLGSDARYQYIRTMYQQGRMAAFQGNMLDKGTMKSIGDAARALKTPMRIYPATHYTMGGLWVDYDLMSTIPGLFVAGEANFSDHGANRLGASALMQGLADGYFVLPYVIGNYLARAGNSKTKEDAASVKSTEKEARDRYQRYVDKGQKGKHTVDHFHRELGKIIWDECGMQRSEKGLKKALETIPKLREEFHSEMKIVGGGEELNRELEKAGRVADFMELGELMCRDALERDESCGCHFREEHQQDGECVRDDEKFAHAAAWEWKGKGVDATEGNHVRHTEKLDFEYVHLATRSYK